MYFTAACTTLSAVKLLNNRNDWFANHFGQQIPMGSAAINYGGTIGGPILLNKTFFFFDWDGTYPGLDHIGTFSGVLSAAGARRRLWRGVLVFMEGP